jgi:threonine dehydrogenase-like Zn-dependent dehydrogenase
MRVRTTLLDDSNRLRLETVDLPDNGSEGALVRVLYGGICGTDLHLLAGHDTKPRPLSIGHEFVGEIVELPGAPRTIDGRPVAVGDRVVVEPGFSCGDCDYCRRHGALMNLCMGRRCHGLESLDGDVPLLGGLSEYVRLSPAVHVQRIPDELPTARAALSEPLAVAVRAAERALASGRPDVNVGPSLGATAAVIGLGPIGLCVAVTLARLGATVVGLDVEPARVALAGRLGIDAGAVQDGQGDAPAALLALTNGLGADVVVECAGAPSAFALAFDLVRRGGRIVVLGHFYSAGSIEFDPVVVCRNDLEVVGSALGPREAYPKAAMLLSRADIPWDVLVRTTFPLSNVTDAFELAARRTKGKILVGPGE